ncbi:phosphonate ABC transporter, permease protein PhnE [Caldalkalibacillus salinus]|uniref:phosphonate ABC transporter, permease protein PhnE n=1 Tax=Caldalkalibacillus salinus TaxID=2803787 RepID=UPI001923EAA5|nr:phosphonate ABC transporter, permease protein PhnE [Caldalkalibacillus salinus]
MIKKGKRIPLIPLKKKIYFLLIALIIGTFYIYSAVRTNASVPRLLEGIPDIYDFFINDLFPPSVSYYKTAGLSLLETWNMALLSTSVAAIVCLPFSFLAASNINKNVYLYQVVRFGLNVLRTIPEIILALIFVAMVGYGPFPGILALIFFSMGILAKLISETVEAIDPGPLEAIRATGGNVIQVICYGVIPQIIPHYVSYTLYVLEINVRASIVLGFVGAGGVGQLILEQMGWLNFDRVAMIILMTFVAVVIIDTVSTRLRERLV